MYVLASPAFSNRKFNPYNARLYAEMSNLGVVVGEFSPKRTLTERYDIVHVHWPDFYINEKNPLKAVRRMLILALTVLVVRLRGASLVWTAHNVLPHDVRREKLTRRYLHWFAGCCDGLIFLSQSSMDHFFAVYPLTHKPVCAVIPHGHYRSAYPTVPDKLAARQTLGLPENKTVILYFGMIKPYKNVDVLIDAFKALGDKKTVLVIAGMPDTPALERKLVTAVSGRDDIHCFFTFILDADVPTYFSAADLVALPYKEIQNSGTVLLALSFNRPVIVPNLGSLAEVQRAVAADWIQLYDGSLEIALRRAISKPIPVVVDLAAFDWHAIAIETLALYRAVLTRGR
jgi:beta-1,4-mannosyltransferase